jgi:hypothetical protein
MNIYLDNAQATGSVWNPAQRPLITSPGDIQQDGYPDTFETTNGATGPIQLWTNASTINDGSGIAISGRTVLDDGSTTNWSTITGLF